MRIVIDTNVLMAGLLKEAIVREILISPKNDFFLPEAALKEVKKYADELCEKADYSDTELQEIVSYLMERISLVKDEEIKPYMKKAEEVMEIDKKDAPFLATCLAINADGIWSFDKHFHHQSVVRVFKTEELAKMR